jgi:tRNA A37 methylthiotransferase MiaB
LKYEPKRLYINEKAKDSFLTDQVRFAHPQAQIRYIKYNTEVFKPKYGLVDLRPRAHFKEKRSKIAVLARNAKWTVQPNGRSTDYLPSIMMTQGCGFGCTYCYTDRDWA